MLNAFKLATKHTIINTAVILALSACASTGNNASSSTAANDVGNKDYREAIGVFSDPSVSEGMDPIAAAAFWGTRYNTNQSDPNVAVNFSKSLRKIGSNDEAVSVMQKTAPFRNRQMTGARFPLTASRLIRSVSMTPHGPNTTARSPCRRAKLWC
mgnify:CR=1 FL=1